MTHETDAVAVARRGRQVERYILALDRGDFDTVTAILSAAETDPELDRLLVEVDGALHVEAQLSTRADDAKTVRTLLRKHLPSAFAEPEAVPPTVGDVAARLQAGHASGQQPLVLGDLAANRQLLTDRTPLDRPITGKNVRDLASTLQVAASDRYWELFRQAGIALVMARRSRGRVLSAARDRSTRKPAANQPPASDPT